MLVEFPNDSLEGFFEKNPWELPHGIRAENWCMLFCRIFIEKLQNESVVVILWLHMKEFMMKIIDSTFNRLFERIPWWTLLVPVYSYMRRRPVVQSSLLVAHRCWSVSSRLRCTPDHFYSLCPPRGLLATNSLGGPNLRWPLCHRFRLVSSKYFLKE